jgi:hypothetical protein
MVVDEIETDQPLTIDWLLHGKEKFELNEKEQLFISHRMNENMQVKLLSQEGFEFSQSDEWPVDPKEGYPMVETDPPVKQWHFKGRLNQQGTKTIITALMSVYSNNYKPCLITIENEEGKNPNIRVQFEDGGKADILVNLDTSMVNDGKTLFKIKYQPVDGNIEELDINSINSD